MKRSLLFLTSVLVGCSSSAEHRTELLVVPSSPYRLDAGDEVRVTVFGFDAAGANYVVSDQGTISLPLLGTVPIAGKTVAEVETGVAEALRNKDIVNTPSVNAQVVKYRPFFILGEVQRPGQYAYVPGMTVLNAVSIAGGYTFRAEKKNVIIDRRNGAESIKGRGNQDTLVMPGDNIQVRESWF